MGKACEACCVTGDEIKKEVIIGKEPGDRPDGITRGGAENDYDKQKYNSRNKRSEVSSRYGSNKGN